MRSWILALLSMFVLPVTADVGVSSSEISIYPAGELVVTAGLPVLLMDIGGATASDDVLKKVQAIEVTSPMVHGEVRTFRSSELARLLKEQIGSDSSLASMRWTYFVPEKLKIRASSREVSLNRINSLILQRLVEICSACEFALSDVKLPQIFGRGLVGSLVLDTSALKVSGSFLLPLRMKTGAAESVYYVTGRTIAKTKALMTTRSLQMGEKVGPNEVKEEMAEIGLGGDAFARLEDLQSQVVARPLPAGRAIVRSDLKKEIVVQRGQMIRAVSGNEVFEVSTQMLADENGALGDIVRLKNTETQKLMSGKVVERGVVRIQ